MWSCSSNKKPKSQESSCILPSSLTEGLPLKSGRLVCWSSLTCLTPFTLWIISCISVYFQTHASPGPDFGAWGFFIDGILKAKFEWTLENKRGRHARTETSQRVLIWGRESLGSGVDAFGLRYWLLQCDLRAWERMGTFAWLRRKLDCKTFWRRKTRKYIFGPRSLTTIEDYWNSMCPEFSISRNFRAA